MLQDSSRTSDMFGHRSRAWRKTSAWSSSVVAKDVPLAAMLKTLASTPDSAILLQTCERAEWVVLGLVYSRTGRRLVSFRLSSSRGGPTYGTRVSASKTLVAVQDITLCLWLTMRLFSNETKIINLERYVVNKH